MGDGTKASPMTNHKWLGFKSSQVVYHFVGSYQINYAVPRYNPGKSSAQQIKNINDTASTLPAFETEFKSGRKLSPLSRCQVLSFGIPMSFDARIVIGSSMSPTVGGCCRFHLRGVKGSCCPHVRSKHRFYGPKDVSIFPTKPLSSCSINMRGKGLFPILGIIPNFDEASILGTATAPASGRSGFCSPAR